MGIATTNIPQQPVVDELIGNRSIGGVQSTVRIPIARLAALMNAIRGPDYKLLSDLQADLAWEAGALGSVYGDPTSANKGIYKKYGASGAGGWTWIGPLLNLDTSALEDAIAAKAPLASPGFTGTPTGPTADPGTSTTQLSTTAFVAAAVTALLGGAPGSLNTLAKLASAIGNDASFASTMAAALAAKAPLASPGLTGTPTAPTAAPGTSTTQLSTTAFVAAAITALLGGAPGSLNTLAKLATAIGNDASFASTMTAALAAKAPLTSPAFLGTPTVPTAPAGTNTAQAASTAFVATALANLLASAPAALDTLNELATAIGNDPNFATTMINALAAKAPLASPGLTGTPTAPTAAPGTSTTQLSTTAFVAAAITALLGGAPGSLNTLAKLATAIGNDASFAATMATALAGKVPTTVIASADDGENVIEVSEATTQRGPIYVDAEGLHLGPLILAYGGEGVEISNPAGRTPFAIGENGVEIWGLVSSADLAAELDGVVKAEDASAPILGADLFFAGASDEIVIDPRNIHTVRSDEPQAITTVSSVVAPPGREFITTSRGEPIVLQAARLGPTVTVTTRPFNGTNRIIQTMAVHNKPLPGSGSPKMFMLGDSIFHRQVSTYVRAFMVDMGYTPTFIGTIGGSADGSASNEAGPLGETREGWATRDFIAPPSDADSTSVLAAGGEAAYLAASKETRRTTNPFLNASVFDFPYYLSRFGFPNPDGVLIALGMNDEEELGNGAVADYIANMPTILTSMRSAMAASAPIIMWGTTRPRSTTGDSKWLIRRELLRAGISIVRERAALGEAIAWCDVSASTSQEAGWPLAAGTADPATGATDTSVSDSIHMSDVNRIRAGRMLAAAAHNMLSL